ncbi:MAG: MMPL family transporter [Actinomycetia bacterium]|nr:MMPL family transporter [Actinomycetes bacterium]
MLQRISNLAIAAPNRIVGVAALVVLATAIFGIPVTKSLSSGGFQDPTSESAMAEQLLTEKFGQSDQQLLITVAAPGGATGRSASAVATDIVDTLAGSPHVISVNSAWTSPPQFARELISTDGTTGLIIAALEGGENDAQKYAAALAEEVAYDRPGVTVRAGGIAMVYAEITAQTARDLLVMEAIAIPISFIVLVWVFGGLLAASLPMVVGLMAVLGSMTVLRLITLATDVSIFALNLAIALGLALAIDYTLLIVSRYRDELAGGADQHAALVRTMATSGRTVLFSATTVALSMAAMALFPMYFLKSFAYAGIATVAFAAAAAVVVTPAAIILLGSRLNAYDIRLLIRRLLNRPDPVARPVQQRFWYRSAKFVMRRPVRIGLAISALLLLLGAPFLGVTWGHADDRVLPASASAHQVGDQLREDFPSNFYTTIKVVIPEFDPPVAADLDRYAADLSRAPDVSAVVAPTGTFVGGNLVGPPSAPTGVAAESAFLTVRSTAPLFSERSRVQLDSLREVAAPAGRSVLMSGGAQVSRDTVEATTERLPWVIAWIAITTFALLFLLTGSVILPLKALVLNVLSLTAAFGALVWIFQDGHLGAFGTTSTGTLEATVPVLLLGIAFGISMDYEVFLLSRIREYWLASGRTRADNEESVALGLAGTGRVITAAALIMSIAFAALIPAQVSFMRMFGVGLALAVLVDATLVRMALVPAFMKVMGRWNWWAPEPLARLHERIGLSHGSPNTTAAAATRPAADSLRQPVTTKGGG